MPTNNVATPVTWTPEVTPDIFDMLADIDGNLIADPSGMMINVYGGFITDTASTSTTWTPDSNGSTTWTPEG